MIVDNKYVNYRGKTQNYVYLNNCSVKDKYQNYLTESNKMFTLCTIISILNTF